MNPERWQQIEELYHAALERAESERAGFLEQACGGDEGLRGEVESLLSFHQQAGSFIEVPALDEAARALAGVRRPRLGPTKLPPAWWARRFPITASWRNWAAAAWGWFIRPRTRSCRALSP